MFKCQSVLLSQVIGFRGTATSSKKYSLTENTVRRPYSVLRDMARTDDDRARELWLHTKMCS